MRVLLRWEPPLHRTNDRIADVPDVGRYHVKRSAPRATTWDVRLNGKQIGVALSAEEAIGIAERDAHARNAG